MEFDKKYACQTEIVQRPKIVLGANPVRLTNKLRDHNRNPIEPI